MIFNLMIGNFSNIYLCCVAWMFLLFAFMISQIVNPEKKLELRLRDTYLRRISMDVFIICL